VVQKKQNILRETNSSFISKHQVVLFFIFAIVVSGVFAIPLLLSIYKVIPVELPGILGLIAAFGSSIAAVIVASLSDGKTELKKLWGGLKKWRVHPLWYLFAIFVNTAMTLLATGLFALFGGSFPSISEKLPQLLPIAVFLTIQAGLGEEIGWRGFATPKLQEKFSGLTAVFIVSGVWLIWHIPLFFVPEGLQANIWDKIGFLPAVAFYGVNLIAQSIIYTWSYNSTGGSVLMPIFLHGSLNWSAWFLSMNDVPSMGMMPLMLFLIVEIVVALIIVIASGKDLNWDHVKSG
jgi:membrane protease YdiL (CAAX protease family)